MKGSTMGRITSRNRAALILLCVTLFSPLEATPFGVGKGIVREKDRIALPGIFEETRSWETRDLRVDYRCRAAEGRLHISGVIRFSDAIRFNANLVRQFHMEVIFVDGRGRVLRMSGLVTGGFERPDDPLLFKNTLAIPADASAMAFFYQAEGSSGGDAEGGGSPFFFWEYPVH